MLRLISRLIQWFRGSTSGRDDAIGSAPARTDIAVVTLADLPVLTAPTPLPLSPAFPPAAATTIPPLCPPLPRSPQVAGFVRRRTDFALPSRIARQRQTNLPRLLVTAPPARAAAAPKRTRNSRRPKPKMTYVRGGSQRRQTRNPRR